MKYIKKFEVADINNLKNNSLYKINDYIHFYDEDAKGGKLFIDDKDGIILGMFVREGILRYCVEILDEQEKGQHTNILSRDIYRLLTTEEIENIEIRNNSNKYNL